MNVGVNVSPRRYLSVGDGEVACRSFWCQRISDMPLQLIHPPCAYSACTRAWQSGPRARSVAAGQENCISAAGINALSRRVDSEIRALRLHERRLGRARAVYRGHVEAPEPQRVSLIRGIFLCLCLTCLRGGCRDPAVSEIIIGGRERLEDVELAST